jgi:hypothetical protein
MQLKTEQAHTKGSASTEKFDMKSYRKNSWRAGTHMILVKNEVLYGASRFHRLVEHSVQGSVKKSATDGHGK